MAITTNNSISVNPLAVFMICPLFFCMNRYSPFARVESTPASFNLILPEVPLNSNRFKPNFFLSGLIELNILICVSVFRAIWGIFDQGPCREIRWKSFISPASPIAEQNGDCHKCLNGRMLQPDSQTNPEGRGKSPKFEIFLLLTMKHCGVSIRIEKEGKG